MCCMHVCNFCSIKEPKKTNLTIFVCHVNFNHLYLVNIGANKLYLFLM